MDNSNTNSTGLALFGAITYLSCYVMLVKKPVCISGNTKVDRIVQKCKTLKEVFWPTPFCWNAHFQFVPFVIRGIMDKANSRFKWHREEILLPDGEVLALDWAAYEATTSPLPIDNEDTTPVLMLHHGAMCDSSDIPGQDYIAPALDRGWKVCILNRRGHTGSLRRPKWNFFGCVHDVSYATQSIKDRRPNAKLFTIGLSSGSGIVANIFGYNDDINHFHAGVGVCPGYSIEKCMSRFSSPYMEFLLWRGKEFFMKANQSLLEHLPGYKECIEATDLQEWLKHSYAMAGYTTTEEYFRIHNPINNAYKTTRPVLFINSENDPLCVVQNYHEEVHRTMKHQPCLATVLTKTGSHLPFYEGITMTNWAEKILEIKEMKFKRKVLYDKIGSSSQTRATAREITWGIVEKIKLTNEVSELIESEVVELPVGLPVGFSSSNEKNKRKRKRGKDQNLTDTENSTSSNKLPIPKYNGTLLEDHVYYMKDNESFNTVRIRGVGPSLPAGDFVIVKIINHNRIDSSISTSELIEVSRSLLIEIPSSERVAAHKLVQQDEQYILQKGKPESIHLKYWDQRYRLLSRFDHGIQLDTESWYSITPELVAKHVTMACIGRLSNIGYKCNKVLDCFSGCGGNTIPFVAKGSAVISVDLDKKKLEYLRQNCEVYGVQQPENHCICADVYTLLTALLPSTTVAKIQDQYQQSLLEEDEKDEEEGEEKYVPTEPTHTSTDPGDSEGKNMPADGELLHPCLSKANRVVTHSNGAITKVKCTVPGQYDDLTSTVPISEKGLTAEGIPIFPGGDISNISEEAKENAQNPDLIILSPPWGGPNYLNAESYCLYTMLSSGCGQYLAQLAAAVCPNLLYLIPVNTNVDQVHSIAEIIGQPYVIEYILVNHSPKLMAVYMGPIAGKRNNNTGNNKEIVPEYLPDVITDINPIQVENSEEKSIHKHFDD